jgi:hypothetical protein
MENMKGKTIMNSDEFKAAAVCVVAFVVGLLVAFS